MLQCRLCKSEMDQLEPQRSTALDQTAKPKAAIRNLAHVAPTQHDPLRIKS